MSLYEQIRQIYKDRRKDTKSYLQMCFHIDKMIKRAEKGKKGFGEGFLDDFVTQNPDFSFCLPEIFT